MLTFLIKTSKKFIFNLTQSNYVNILNNLY